jgi:hypothetical protein
MAQPGWIRYLVLAKDFDAKAIDRLSERPPELDLGPTTPMIE